MFVCVIKYNHSEGQTRTKPNKTADVRKENKMKKIYLLNETRGYFPESEEALCKEYCKVNGYTYRIVYIDLGY